MTADAGKPLDDKIVVVTGASRGLGRALVQTLHASGATVVPMARPSADLDDVQALLGEDTLALPCDLADPAAVRAAIDRVGARYGRIDTVVHNAGTASLLTVEEASPADIQREFAVNVLGPANATSAAIPWLRKAGGGDLVFVSSESVRMPFPFMSLYVASKAGLEGLAAALRGELRPQGTRVSVLRIGGLDSGTISRDWDPQRAADFAAAATAGGFFQFTGKLFSAQSVAQTLLAILTLPRDVNLDIVEARGAAAL